MQSVNPPGNKACQTGVENGHLRGNYPPFSALHAIISRMFWSGPLRRTSLGCSRTICIAAMQTARTLGSGTTGPGLPATSSCGNVMSRLRMASPLSVPEVFSLRAVTPRRTFCNDGNVLCRYSAHFGSHQPHVATGSWTCGEGGRRATFFIVSVINFM